MNATNLLPSGRRDDRRGRACLRWLIGCAVLLMLAACQPSVVTRHASPVTASPVTRHASSVSPAACPFTLPGETEGEGYACGILRVPQFRDDPTGTQLGIFYAQLKATLPAADQPPLLFLAGGPGGSQLATARYALGGLEEHFVVVNWEQPGAGKSFDAVDRATLTPERYIEDAHALILHLRERFDQEKVYVLGESWGSALGVMLVQRYPELFHAFIGTGQMVAFLETDQMDYDFALQWAQVRGDIAKVETLVRQGPPPYYADVAWKSATYLLDTYAYMNANPAIADNGANTFRDLAAPEYGLYDKVSWVRGVIDTLGVVYPQLWDVDFRTQAPKLDVPVYFLIGRHDINAPVTLTEEYYDLLDAPHKELVWFEHSGHTPWVHESARFVQVMVETVLGQTQLAQP